MHEQTVIMQKTVDKRRIKAEAGGKTNFPLSQNQHFMIFYACSLRHGYGGAGCVRYALGSVHSHAGNVLRGKGHASAADLKGQRFVGGAAQGKHTLVTVFVFTAEYTLGQVKGGIADKSSVLPVVEEAAVFFLELQQLLQMLAVFGQSGDAYLAAAPDGYIPKIKAWLRSSRQPRRQSCIQRFVITGSGKVRRNIYGNTVAVGALREERSPAPRSQPWI